MMNPKNQALELLCIHIWRHTLSYQFQPCLIILPSLSLFSVTLYILLLLV